MNGFNCISKSPLSWPFLLSSINHGFVFLCVFVAAVAAVVCPSIRQLFFARSPLDLKKEKTRLCPGSVPYTYWYYWKIHYLTREFHVKFYAKNRYRTNRDAMSAISVCQVKFNVEFTKTENAANVANFSTASFSSRNTARNTLASLANQSARILWAMRFIHMYIRYNKGHKKLIYMFSAWESEHYIRQLIAFLNWVKDLVALTLCGSYSTTVPHCNRNFVIRNQHGAKWFK